MAIERKLAKSSYQGMVHSHGYGTLIVGLPLWFATEPLDPLRVENVIDDFAMRVGIGLKLQARQLRMKSCPFWRIVVIWKGSVESIREWKAKARLNIYEDPSYRSIGSLPINSGSLTEPMLDALEQVAHEIKDGDAFGGFTRHVAAARRRAMPVELDSRRPRGRVKWSRFPRRVRGSGGSARVGWARAPWGGTYQATSKLQGRIT